MPYLHWSISSPDEIHDLVIGFSPPCSAIGHVINYIHVNRFHRQSTFDVIVWIKKVPPRSRSHSWTLFSIRLTCSWLHSASFAISRRDGLISTSTHPRNKCPSILRRRRMTLNVRFIAAEITREVVSSSPLRAPPNISDKRQLPATSDSASTSSDPCSYSLGCAQSAFSSASVQSSQRRCVSWLPMRFVMGSYWQIAHRTCARRGSLT